MPKLSSFMICESITNMPGSQGMIPQLIGPTVVLRPPIIPGGFSFGISIGVTGVLFNRENTFRLSITSPDGQEIYNSGDINIGVIPNDNIIPQENQGFVISTDIRNLLLPQEGVYNAVIMVNNEIVGKQMFPIYAKGEEK